MRKKKPDKVGPCEYCARRNADGEGLYVRYICWACKDEADWLAYMNLGMVKEFLDGGWRPLKELM